MFSIADSSAQAADGLADELAVSKWGNEKKALDPGRRPLPPSVDRRPRLRAVHTHIVAWHPSQPQFKPHKRLRTLKESHFEPPSAESTLRCLAKPCSPLSGLRGDQQDLVLARVVCARPAALWEQFTCLGILDAAFLGSRDCSARVGTSMQEAE